MAVILREGKTPTGVEVRTILKHVIARIRQHWHKVRILVRGDSHYGRPEAMAWCEANGVDYIFGLGGNPVLHNMVRPIADELCVRRAITGAEKRRTWKGLRYGAKSWDTQRRVIAGSRRRCSASTSAPSSPHCGERPNIFTRPSTAGAARRRTSSSCTRLSSPPIIPRCRDPRANQVRLILHTAAYWLLHTLRAVTPKRSHWAQAEFNTLRLRLIKIAARVVEGAARIRVSGCQQRVDAYGVSNESAQIASRHWQACSAKVRAANCVRLGLPVILGTFNGAPIRPETREKFWPEISAHLSFFAISQPDRVTMR